MTTTDGFQRMDDLFTAVGNGHVEALEEALAEGFDPLRDLWHGASIVSCALGHSEATLAAVFAMIKTVDIGEIAGYSPLLSAVAGDRVADVRSLLRMGASVEWTNSEGDNVFHRAVDDCVSKDAVDLLMPHATLHALLTHCVAMNTPIMMAHEDGVQERFVLYCRRYVELGGSLDVRVGISKTPMRQLIELAGINT